MKTPSQDDLLGYVLGALDAQEHRNVQQSINDNPEIEELLLQIKNSLLPLDYLESSGPRTGLARRTCESVAGWQNEQAFDSNADQQIPGLVGSLDSIIQSAVNAEAPKKSEPRFRSSVTDRILHPNTWSIPDVLVGVALIAIVTGILFPMISYSRYNSRIVACQSNLTEVGIALNNYSLANEGQFVIIPRQGPLAAIGCIGPMLKDSGFLPDDSVLACPGVAANLPPVHIPSCNQMNNALCEEEINYCRQNMLGHFGFSMGYRVDGRYCPPRNMGRSNVVLVADRPSSGLPGRISANHCKRGQNLLFEDLRVVYVKGPAYGGNAIYLNDYGIVGPGSNVLDIVIAPAHLSPTQANPLISLFRSDAD